jgi:hypothetical protein
VKKTRRNKNPEPGSDSIRTDTALAVRVCTFRNGAQEAVSPWREKPLWCPIEFAMRDVKKFHYIKGLSRGFGLWRAV